MSCCGSRNNNNNGNSNNNDNSCNNSCNNNYDESFYKHICRYIGQTVTIFTASGGESGCGFTGVILSVTDDFVRLTTQQGTPPANPLCGSICDHDYSCTSNSYNGFCSDGSNGNGNGNGSNGSRYTVGSICDIPLCKIVAFCHNAV